MTERDSLCHVVQKSSTCSLFEKFLSRMLTEAPGGATDLRLAILHIARIFQ